MWKKILVTVKVFATTSLSLYLSQSVFSCEQCLGLKSLTVLFAYFSRQSIKLIAAELTSIAQATEELYIRNTKPQKMKSWGLSFGNHILSWSNSAASKQLHYQYFDFQDLTILPLYCCCDLRKQNAQEVTDANGKKHKQISSKLLDYWLFKCTSN